MRAQKLAQKVGLTLYQIDYREDFVGIIIKDFMWNNTEKG